VPASDWAVGRGSGSARRYSGGSFEYRSRVLPVIHSLSCSSTSLLPPSFAFPVYPCEWKGREWQRREGGRERDGERERERERERESQSSGEESIEQGTRRHRLPPTTPDTTTTNRHPEKCPARSDIGLADSAARRLHGIIHPRYLAVRSPLRRLIRVLPSEIRYRPPPAPARSEFARKRNGSRTKHGSARAKDTADLKYTTRQYEA